MSNIIKHISKVNNIYHIMDKCYRQLKTMFKNHKPLLGKIELSEKLFHDALLTIANKTDEIITKKEFLKIVKSIKDEKK